jgi:hypothetical protein
MLKRSGWRSSPVLAALGLALIACDQPTEPSPASPVVAGLRQSAGVRVVGRDTVYSGNAAREMLPTRDTSLQWRTPSDVPS